MKHKSAFVVKMIFTMRIPGYTGVPSMKPDKLVLSIPHAGTAIPDEIRGRIPHNDHVIRNESDLCTEQIFSIPDARTVIAPYSRIIADPNRAPDEIYTEGVLRSLGVVMLSLPTGEDTFTEEPSLDEISQWIHRYHHPYQQRLSKAMDGAGFVIDGHSMWSSPAPGHFGAQSGDRADIVLGNQYFCSCSAETTDFFASFFSAKGYSVAINDPYPGRYILGTYCSRILIPGIQIEINRKLYLNEQTLDPRDTDIKKLQSEFSELTSEFCQWFTGAEKTEKKDPVDMSEHCDT
jgi:N-formylglutamate deformylase